MVEVEGRRSGAIGGHGPESRSPGTAAQRQGADRAEVLDIAVGFGYECPVRRGKESGPVRSELIGSNLEVSTPGQVFALQNSRLRLSF